MKEQEWIFERPDEKKHSVRYHAQIKDKAAMESVYVLKTAFEGGKFPKAIRITLKEEV